MFNINCREEKVLMRGKKMIILLFMAALVLLYIIGTNLIFYFLVKGFLYVLPILIVYWIYVYLKNHKKSQKDEKRVK